MTHNEWPDMASPCNTIKSEGQIAFWHSCALSVPGPFKPSILHKGETATIHYGLLYEINPTSQSSDYACHILP